MNHLDHSYHTLNNDNIFKRQSSFAVEMSELRSILKRAYKLIYQSDLNFTQAITQIKDEFNSTPEIINILAFIEKSNRGLI